MDKTQILRNLLHKILDNLGEKHYLCKQKFVSLLILGIVDMSIILLSLNRSLAIRKFVKYEKDVRSF